MSNKRLALTKDGKVTFCSADPRNIGKGRCNHIDHQRDDETPEEFTKRTNSSMPIIEVSNIYFRDVINNNERISNFVNANYTNEELIRNYVIYSKLAKQFREKTLSSKDVGKFFVVSDTEVIDEKQLNALLAERYGSNKAKFDTELNNFKDMHPEYYTTTQILNSFKEVFNDEEIITGTNEILTSFTDVEEFFYSLKVSEKIKDSFKDRIISNPVNLVNRKQVKPEFKEDVNKFTEELKKSTGWNEKLLKEELSKELPRTTIKKFNAKRVYNFNVPEKFILDNLLK